MKKTIFLLILLFLSTSCTNNNTEIENILSKLYTITNNGSVMKGNNTVITQLTADDMTFYIYEINDGNSNYFKNKKYYSSILSSVYDKHKQEIKEIAKKNNITITYNYTINDYIDRNYFNDCKTCHHFITIYPNEDTLDTFINEILEIDEIQKLYQIWLNNTINNYAVYDYSYIDDENETSTNSIFNYYKKSSHQD